MAASPAPGRAPAEGAASGEPGPDETQDALLGGRIQLLQPRRGARVSQDALLLADFALEGPRPRRPLGRVLDLGCGTGAVALVLAAADPDASLVGVELQPALADLARRNAALNGCAGRLALVTGDLARPRALPLRAASFELVVANPPFHDAATGRPAPRADRALSRQEVACTLDDVLAAAARFVAPRGRACLVFPAARGADLLGGLLAAGLRPRRLRMVHSVASEAARRVLVEAARGYRGGLTVEPPLVVHGADRRAYTAEAARILGLAANG